ncbi:MAG: Y-family DNA polymerase, partial [Methanobacterium sp.]
MYYFGIIDCNNFYASCERIFNPSLKNRPVVVLSNNDGCVIARSNEAKLLGIKMGEPYFSAKDIILKNKVYVASTNFALYGDISRRVMQIIEEYCEESEVYSIDEAFFRIKLSSKEEVEKYSLNLIQKIKSWTGIPVSVGIGRTKTLAKLAVEFAKKKPNFLHVLYTEDNELYALKNTAIGDVWGIGRQYKLKLRSEGVFTPYDFTQIPDAWVRKIMKVIGQKVLYEL